MWLSVTYNTGITNTGITYLYKYPDQFTNVAIRPVACTLVVSIPPPSVNEVDSHNKSRQSDLSPGKWWVTQYGWLWLYKTVAMGTTITNCWNLFCYGVKRYHYDKLIGVREFSERLAEDWFNNKLSPDRGTPAKLMMKIQFLLAVHFNFQVLFLLSHLAALFLTWLSTGPQLYLLDLSIFPKKNNLNKKGGTTDLLEVTAQGSCLMEKDASREVFGIARDVIGSTRGCTFVNKFIVIVLKCIMTPFFVYLDMFVVWLIHNNDECIGYQLADMTPFMHMMLYKKHDMS